MAGPHVAALVALMISANPSLAGEVDKMEEVIEQTALHLTSTQNCGGTMPNNVFGHGRINALEAVNMVLPSNYAPYVSYSHSLVIVNNQHGLVLTAPDQTRYRVKVSNIGELVSGPIAAVASGSTTIDQASLRMEPGPSNIILRSPNGNYWKVVISDEGTLSAVLIPSLPATTTVQLQGDIFIQKDIKGVVLYSENGQCFLLNVSKRGKLMTIPANCP
jgi:subtilisin family serine protease